MTNIPSGDLNGKIVSLAEEIHERSWAESPTIPIGRAFATSYISRIQKVNSCNFIKYNLLSFDKNYTNALMLSFPELWNKLTIGDWESLATSLSPRPPVERFDPTGRYGDVIFFIKWLDLDYIGLVFSFVGLPDSDKVKIAEYCEANARSLVLSSDDRMDLDDAILCSNAYIENYRLNLLSACPALTPLFHDDNSLKEYSYKRRIELADDDLGSRVAGTTCCPGAEGTRGYPSRPTRIPTD